MEKRGPGLCTPMMANHQMWADGVERLKETWLKQLPQLRAEGWYNAHSGSLGEQTYAVRTEAGLVAAAGQQNPEDKVTDSELEIKNLEEGC